MRELLYTALELEEWNKDVNCSFCSSISNKAVCQIRTRSKATEKIIANDEACQICKEKFENNELVRCENCGRLQIDSDIDIYTGKYVCRCIKRQENVEEKELPVLSPERRQTAFYERQINGLREELSTAEVEIDTHLEALEISEDWHKRQKQELVDKIAELEKENKQLKSRTSEELINKITVYEAEIERLKTQLEQLTSQQVARIEIKPTKKLSFPFFKKS